MGQKESKSSSSGAGKSNKSGSHGKSRSTSEKNSPASNPSPPNQSHVHSSPLSPNGRNDPGRAPLPVSSGRNSSRNVGSSPSKHKSAKPSDETKSLDDSRSTLELYYRKYKDNTEDAILAEGVENFCEDLGVSPTDFIVLVLAWKFQASEMCRFTHEEFINGCQKLKAIDAKGLKQRFPDLIKETKESEKSFKELYQFTFTFGLDHAQGQRALPTDMAVQLWELLFTHKKYPLLDRWLKFLQDNEGIKVITRDTWNMFLPFLQTMRDSLENYDESEAWPTLFDDFVEYEQEAKNS